ncbi:MAG: hypothetical protein NPIRA04_33170 [Nitrospirales bacterium]|nr:MAG: hypothetical protein NPIRA04_33170 [Nitrospirales bacterium]
MKMPLLRQIISCLVYTSMMAALIGCNDESPSSRSASALIDSIAQSQEAFRLGHHFMKIGDDEKALEAYSRAIELEPDFAEAYAFRGQLHVIMGHFRDGIFDLDKMIALDPSASSYRLRADVKATNGYYEEAIRDYNKLLELDPNSAAVYNNRGTAYGENKGYKNAISDITHAIQLAPNEPDYYLNRGKFKMLLGDYDSAMIDVTNCIRLSGGNPDLRPGESREVNKTNFNCMRLLTKLKKAKAP